MTEVSHTAVCKEQPSINGPGIAGCHMEKMNLDALFPNIHKNQFQMY